MFEREAAILRFMQNYGDWLLADIEPEAMCRQPVPEINHPAWIIGHLAFAADAHSAYAGGTPQLPEYKARFGLGSTPSADSADYPAKDELISMWHDANDRLVATATSAGPDLLDQPSGPNFVDHLPTVADFLAFSMTGHTSTHLGQLSNWRRIDGRPSLF